MTSPIVSLLVETGKKNQSAFSELYTATSAKVFGLALGMLRNRDDALEASQEIYLKIWQRAETFNEDTGHAMAWVLTLSRNHILDKLRKSTMATAELDEALAVPDKTPTPEAAAVAADERKGIDKCLDELPSDRASAVKNAYLHGYTYEELAAAFQVPINTMRTWLRRSLLSLRDCMNARQKGGRK